MDYGNLDKLIEHCDEMEVEARYQMRHGQKRRVAHYTELANKYEALSKHLNELRRFRTLYKIKLS